MSIIPEKPSERSRECLMKKYGLTEISLKENIGILKNWFENQQYLPKMNHVNFENWLENQLLMRKNDLEKAKISIELYCNARTTIPKLFLLRDILDGEMIKNFEIMTLSILPGATPKGHCLAIARLEDKNPQNFNFETTMKRCLMVMEYYLKEGLDFSGFHVVIDLCNVQLGHLGRLSIELMQMMKVAMRAYPVSFSRIYLINCPGFFEKGIALFKPFLTKKIFLRLKFFTSDLSSMYEDLPRSILPKDYGGRLESQKYWSDLWIKRFTDLRSYILQCDRIRCDLSPSNGTFRKLEVD